jgi:S1-C subfamily serine protease
VIGGLVVAILGWIAIAAGWIEAKRDESVPLAPLVRPASDEGDGDGLSVGEIYDRSAPGVAFVEASQPAAASSTPFGPSPDGSGTATGSGFVIDDEGHVLTNAHVVAGADDVRVTLGESDSPIDAEVVGQDTSTDVAVLDVDADASDLQPFELADSTELDVGDPVVAIGNPFGLERTVTTGIVSALQREISAPDGFTISDVIQHDASINPGNSGGPLLDARGRVIGINSQIATGGAGGGSVGVGFAVPSNTARTVADQLISGGEVRHAYLGISGADITPEIAAALELGVDQGVLVQRVVPDGPSDAAGLQGGETEVNVEGQQVAAGGDVIVAVDGQAVTGMDAVIAAVNRKQPGDEVVLDVYRGDQQDQITVTLGDRPESVQN